MCTQCSSLTDQAQKLMNILNIEQLFHTAFSLCQSNTLRMVISLQTLYTLHSIVSYQCKKNTQFDYLNPYTHKGLFSDISDKSMRGLSLTSYTRGICQSCPSYHVVLFSGRMYRSKKMCLELFPLELLLGSFVNQISLFEFLEPVPIIFKFTFEVLQSKTF